jgi:hypothetical protein
MDNEAVKIDAEKIDHSIQMLRTYINSVEIEELIASMTLIKQDPQNAAYLAQLRRAFSSLGLIQGAVLTYAPYLVELVSYDLFED